MPWLNHHQVTSRVAGIKKIIYACVNKEKGNRILQKGQHGVKRLRKVSYISHTYNQTKVKN